MDEPIFGTNYVGFVKDACRAKVGHNVICVEVGAAKVDCLNSGVIPIYESGLAPMMQANHVAGHLRFTTDVAEGIAHVDIVFTEVGALQDEDGSADRKYVPVVVRPIGEHLLEPVVVVDNSTVPVSPADMVRAAIAVVLAERGMEFAFDLVSNAEAMQGADAQVVVTEWKKLRNPDFAGFNAVLADTAGFNGRNTNTLAEVEAGRLACNV